MPTFESATASAESRKACRTLFPFPPTRRYVKLSGTSRTLIPGSES
jgi:hypothetical protein